MPWFASGLGCRFLLDGLLLPFIYFRLTGRDPLLNPFFSFTKPKSSVGNTTFIQSQNLQAMSDTATPAQFPGTGPPVPNQDDALRQNCSAIDPNTRTTAVETLTRPNSKSNQQPVTPVRAKRRSSETTIEMSWLPPGWVVEDRIRTSGATAGTVDKVSCSSFSIN